MVLTKEGATDRRVSACRKVVWRCIAQSECSEHMHAFQRCIPPVFGDVSREYSPNGVVQTGTNGLREHDIPRGRTTTNGAQGNAACNGGVSRVVIRIVGGPQRVSQFDCTNGVQTMRYKPEYKRTNGGKRVFDIYPTIQTGRTTSLAQGSA